jgi:hypothetical protein
MVLAVDPDELRVWLAAGLAPFLAIAAPRWSITPKIVLF